MVFILNEQKSEGLEKETQKCPFSGAFLSPNDSPTAYAHLGWRVFYTGCSWLVIGLGLQEGTSFFNNIVLVSSALFFDYLKFSPQNVTRKVVRFISLIVTFLGTFFGIVGMAGVFIVKNIEGVLYLINSPQHIYDGQVLLPLAFVWKGYSINVLLTIVDYFMNVSFAEKEFLKNFRPSEGGH